jgi:hypothetical protein
MLLLVPTSVLGFLVMIKYSELASLAIPTTAPGYKPKSFKFHPDGADIDIVPSALFTGTLAAA